MSNPCESCGLCCIYYPSNNPLGQWGDVRNNELDVVPRRLYKITRKPIVHEEHRKKGIDKFIRSKPDPIWKKYKRCIALEGVQTQEVKCNVYERRPQTCKDFPVGGFMCNMIREWGGLEKLDGIS